MTQKSCEESISGKRAWSAVSNATKKSWNMAPENQRFLRLTFGCSNMQVIGHLDQAVSVEGQEQGPGWIGSRGRVWLMRNFAEKKSRKMGWKIKGDMKAKVSLWQPKRGLTWVEDNWPPNQKGPSVDSFCADGRTLISLLPTLGMNGVWTPRQWGAPLSPTSPFQARFWELQHC